jgi:teichoic acid transport system ATP-binding protein
MKLHKEYPLYKRPIDRILHAFHLSGSTAGVYHALKGVNVDFPTGESIGILGKNGAGKSTLLKIITGVVTPTSGHCLVNGKVSALLELNAGFDQEMTGYENIFLKAALIGFSKEEIEAQLDAIIDFADIGLHLHQPVRTYSSGMKSRLGFSIAVHVDPDILIIDEALRHVSDEVFE